MEDKIMKRIISFFALVLMVIPALSNAQISGTFTIGSGGDFMSFTDAIDTLKSQGVSDPVEFNIVSGSYNEHFIIPEILGVSETNTITFQSQAGVADSVVLFDSTTVDTNYIIKIDGADFVIFKNITFKTTSPDYGRIFYINGDADYLQITGNIFNGNGYKNSGPLIYAEESDCDSLLIQENIFNNAGTCIKIEGSYNIYPEGIQILDNKAEKVWYGISLSKTTSTKIIGNFIDAPYYVGSGRSGIYLNDCDGELEILRNRIYYYNGYGFSISGFSGNASKHGLIANNFIRSSTTSAYSWAVSISNAHYLNLYHNTVITPFGWYAFLLSSGGYGGSHINILNNNFIHFGDETAYSIQISSAVDNSDFNNFYSAGAIASWYNSIYGSVACFELDSLQKVSGMDLHSKAVHPMFPDPGQPYTKHPWLDGAGTPVPEVTVDIDGNPRDPDNPDIGCCEFTSNPLSIPYLGNLTIGNGGDFSGFSAALDSLMLRGISGPVQLDVLPGTYNEQLKIRNIPGASEQDSVVFQSRSSNPEDVTLHYTPPNDTNYVVQFYGADHICFRGMTLFGDTTGTTANYYIFRAKGRVDNLQIKNNILTGPTSSNTHRPLIEFTGSTGIGRIISGNTLRFYNYNGIEFNDNLNSEIEILNNTFYGGNVAISIHDAEILSIKGNRIHGCGIDLYQCSGPLEILENTIYLSNARCIRLRSTSGSAEERGLIANNFLRNSGGGYYHYGIDIDGCGFLDICFNSINITSTDATRGRALNIPGSDSRNLSIANNILCNTGGGYAYYVGNSSPITLSDHNDIYSTGENLAAWNGLNVPDLDSLRTLSGFDMNSVSADPGFISASNLHANSSAIDSMGTPIESILFDIDGEIRDATYPDIGADEFIPGYNYTPVITSEPDTMAYTDSLYQYQVVASDHNADTLTFHLQSAPSWMSINDSTGVVSGIPLYKNAGDTTVTILVADGRGGTHSQTYILHVIPTTGIKTEEDLAPAIFALYQNYPNPFNPKTVIRYALPVTCHLDLSIYNILGQKVTTLINEKKSAGSYQVDWDASGFASGVYFYRLQTSTHIKTKKMILLQ